MQLDGDSQKATKSKIEIVSGPWQIAVRQIVQDLHENDRIALINSRNKLRLSAVANQSRTQSQWRRINGQIRAISNELEYFIPAQIAKEQYLLTSIIEMYLTGVLFTRVRNSLYVIEQDKPGGNVHLYFGGDDGPLGDNHGHLVLNPGRRIDFLRYPGEKRGPQNDFRLPPQDTTVELAS